MYGYPWNKAYRLDYLRDHGIRFPKITHIEDIMFNIAAFEEIASFALLPEVLYHYRNQGQVRLTGKYLADYLELQKMRIRAFLEQQCRWRERKIRGIGSKRFRGHGRFLLSLPAVGDCAVDFPRGWPTGNF